MTRPKESISSPEIPEARLKKRGLSIPWVWIVPIVAAVVAGLLVFKRLHEYSATLTLQLNDADGLKSGQTTLQYRGVVIGELSSVELSKDAKFAVAKIKLKRFASEVACKGSVFWVVRPQFTMGAVTGLGTIIAGPHIEVKPGGGEPENNFVAVEESPLTQDPKGLRLTLLTRRAESLRSGVPIYYRGFEVGSIVGTQLSTNSASVEIEILIKHRYAGLVRHNSKFWNVAGLDVKFGIFRGAEINVESLKSLVVGGIAFATPDDPLGEPVSGGAVFQLNDQSKEEWLKWTPPIEIPPDDTSDNPPKTKKPLFPTPGTSNSPAS